MSDDDKVDLSPVRPLADPARFDRSVASITARALAARRAPRPDPLLAQLVSWARPALALAAAVAALVWLPSLLGGMGSTGSTEVADAAAGLSEWALQGQPPSTEQLLETMGGPYGRDR